MKSKLYRYKLLMLLFIGAVLGATESPAQVCQPGRTVQLFVGDTASDAACHYNDIQSALNAVGSCPTQVNITRMHIWSNQHLSTGGKNVTLQGWGDGVTCFTLSQQCNSQVCPVPSSTAPLVTINANGAGGRVLNISGANSVVTLRHLIITGGAAGSGDGGGIGFSGTGRLNLFTTAVNYNNAGYGAGINFKGTGVSPETAILTLLNETLLVGNSASVSGGGIRIEGQAQLVAESPRTLITLNVAGTGYGGGIEVLGPAEAYIGSPGYNGAPVVQGNTARYGGGIAVIASNAADGEADLHLYSKDPTQPVGVGGNAAEIAGGAFYVRSNYDAFQDARIRVYGARITDNSAPDGAIAYVADDPDFGGVTDLAIGGNLRIADDPPPRGAPGCPTQPPCTRMSGNKTRSLNNLPIPGGALFGVDRTGLLVMKRVEISGNEATDVVRLEPVSANQVTSAILLNCLIAKNTLSGSVLRQPGGGLSYLRMNSCTIADNVMNPGPVVFSRDGGLELRWSIFNQPGRPTLDYVLTNEFVDFILDNLLSDSVATLPASLSIIEGLPKFVDAAAGNYRLRHDSLGVDFAVATNASDLDLDGNPRVKDLLGIFNQFGPQDLGAYELTAEPPSEGIFSDSFESGTTSSSQ